MLFLRKSLRLLLPILLFWSLSTLSAEATSNSNNVLSTPANRRLQPPPDSSGSPPPEGGGGGGPPPEDGEGGRPPKGVGGGGPPPEDGEGGRPPKGPPPSNRKGDYKWDVTSEIPPFAAALSIFGSLWIIIEVLRDRKKQRLCYHRLIFAMSLFDLAASLSYLITSFIEDPLPWTRTTDCEVPGFILYWASLTIPMYNVALATYFYLSIVSGWREEKTWKKFERYAQVFIPLVALIVAIVPWPMDLYNKFHNYCFVIGPRDMGDVTMIFMLTYRIVVLLATLFVTVMMMAVYCQVRKTFDKSDRFTFSRQGQSNFSADSSSSDAVTNSGRKSQRIEIKKAKKRVNRVLNRVRTMAFLYTIPFYATWTVPVIWMFIDQSNHDTGTPELSELTFYVMHVWLALFLPLQGFMNWIIYMFPRFQRIREEDRSKSICVVLAAVLGGIFKSRRRKIRVKPPAGKSSQNSAEAFSAGDDDNESMIGDMMYSDDSSESQQSTDQLVDQLESGKQETGTQESGRQSPISRSSQELWVQEGLDTEPTNDKKDEVNT